MVRKETMRKRSRWKRWTWRGRKRGSTTELLQNLGKVIGESLAHDVVDR